MLWVCTKIRWSACTHPDRCPTLPTMAQPSQPSSEQSEQPTDRHVTVVEAATILSITPDAVRSRLRRGTLRKDRGPDGEVLVVLDGDASATDRPFFLFNDTATAEIYTLSLHDALPTVD